LRLEPISFGNVTIDMPVILAPMTGVTDLPFRRIVRRYGSGLNVTEMIASQAMIRETRQSLQKAAWAAEEALPPRSVAAALGGPAGVGGFRVIPLAVVRSASALREAIAECARTGAVAVCDAETPEDLSAVAVATLAQSVPVALAGTAALARALAGLLELPGDGPGHAARPLPERPVLVVAGTRAPSLDAQFAALAAAGATMYDLDEATLARAARDGLPHDGPATTAVRLARGHAWRAADVDRLAAAVVPLARATGAHLLLTGGETARRVLDALGVDELTVLGPLGAGAVLCRTADGRAVVTRPGSFGGDGHLVDLTARLRALMTETAATSAGKDS